MQPPLDLAVVRRLLRHEALVHAVPNRVLRDLGDAFLLHDPTDAEPFWNRLEAVRFPSERAAFDRRLAEIGIQFATVGRQPHIWLLPPYDAPEDLFDRLVANGFEDAGAGHLMATTDATPARAAIAEAGDAELRIHRYAGLNGPEAEPVAAAIVSVLLAAFGVGEERRDGVIVETLATLADRRFTHYLVRLDGAPVAVARRATFDGISYLSSIGTIAQVRGRGVGRRITAAATVDAFEAGSKLVHLGVFADNVPGKRLYERLGFAFVGEAGPDMLLVGSPERG
jgi:ribosomal protein S18 acetylase RimI-like enzyme